MMENIQLEWDNLSEVQSYIVKHVNKGETTIL